MQEVFHRKPGFRKVILATNIAESSITISEVEVVVDFCLSKILFCDQQTNNLKLKSVWIDGNNAIQVFFKLFNIWTVFFYLLASREEVVAVARAMEEVLIYIKNTRV